MVRRWKKRICPRCNNKGEYMYDEDMLGKVHVKPCELCCKHPRGFYEVSKLVWACKVCGHKEVFDAVSGEAN